MASTSVLHPSYTSVSLIYLRGSGVENVGGDQSWIGGVEWRETKLDHSEDEG